MQQLVMSIPDGMSRDMVKAAALNDMPITRVGLKAFIYGFRIVMQAIEAQKMGGELEVTVVIKTPTSTIDVTDKVFDF